MKSSTELTNRSLAAERGRGEAVTLDEHWEREGDVLGGFWGARADVCKIVLVRYEQVR
jgi:hypothetical protein